MTSLSYPNEKPHKPIGFLNKVWDLVQIKIYPFQTWTPLEERFTSPGLKE
jgi:hypothetical protein